MGTRGNHSSTRLEGERAALKPLLPEETRQRSQLLTDPGQSYGGPRRTETLQQSPWGMYTFATAIWESPLGPILNQCQLFQLASCAFTSVVAHLTLPHLPLDGSRFLHSEYLSRSH